ncbi:MAG: hypothetical protein K6G63_09050 [Eubacterium sp.]|nr:hypothetical protein [Eubacterium sp.]
MKKEETSFFHACQGVWSEWGRGKRHEKKKKQVFFMPVGASGASGEEERGMKKRRNKFFSCPSGRLERVGKRKEA